MAFTIPRPGNSPDWFGVFAATLQKVLSKADRQNIKYLRKDFTFADANTSLNLSDIPPNAVILKPLTGAEIHEAFNAGTTNTFAIGTATSTTLYGSGMSLTALGFVPVTAAVSYVPSTTARAQIKGTITTTGAAATAGKGVFVVAYIVSQEG